MKKNLLLLLTATLSLFAKSSPDAGTTLLEKTSQAFTDIAEKTMPATVFIKALSACQNAAPMNPMFDDEFFRRFFGQPFQNPNAQPQLSGGSGFFVSSDGYIVTNNHVVKDATEITVQLNDGREYPATIFGTDPRTDLAVLKIEEKNLPFLTFGDSDSLKIGEWVVAIGNPFGLEATLTVGVVSAKGRQDIGIASYEDFIQTDAAINPGNSGGPLLNLDHQVIGVNTAIFSKSGGYMGIGLAIPSKMVQNVISQILDNGSVKRAYLGVILQPVDKELSDALGLEKQEGVLISDVVPDSPAATAGLQSGDIILQYNNKPVKNVNKLRNDIAMMTPGTKLTLTLLRDTKQLTLTATLGSQEEQEEGQTTTTAVQKLGLDVETLTPELSQKLGYAPNQDGVVITKVSPNSPAAIAGLRPNALIIGFASNMNQQKKIRNTKDLSDAIRDLGDKKHIILIVRHQNYQRYYTLKIK